MNTQEIRDRIKSVKAKIEKLIEGGQLQEAKKYLAEFDAMLPGDPDICSMMAVVHIVEGDPDKAENVIKRGLANDTVNLTCCIISHIYEIRNKLDKSLDLYQSGNCCRKLGPEA